MTTLPIPKSISSKTAQILAIERDIVSNKFQLSLIRNYNEDQRRALVPRFLILSFAVNEEADTCFITAENKIKRFFDYLHTTSSLCVVNRLQTFWRYVLLSLTLLIAKFWLGKSFIFRNLQNVISTQKINQNFMSFYLMQAHSTQPTSCMINIVQSLGTLLLN